jgi:hypothetical protein
VSAPARWTISRYPYGVSRTDDTPGIFRFIDDLAQQIVLGPGEKFHLGYKLRFHPMHAAEKERRAEAGRARRRHVERHLRNGERLQPPPQPFELGLVDAGLYGPESPRGLAFPCQSACPGERAPMNDKHEDDLTVAPVVRKKTLGLNTNRKASLSVHPLAAERRLKRAIAWHNRIKDQERAVKKN